MTAIVDNNLPLSLARRLRQLQTQVAVQHVVDLGVQDQTDQSLRRRWNDAPLI